MRPSCRLLNRQGRWLGLRGKFRMNRVDHSARFWEAAVAEVVVAMLEGKYHGLTIRCVQMRLGWRPVRAPKE